MNDIIKICKIHGELFLSSVIKARINSQGKRTYRCKLCMRESHAKHYQNNRDKVLESHKKYISQDPIKAQQQKNASKRKMYSLDPQKYLKKTKEYEKNNPEKRSARQKRFKDKAVLELKDSYVKQNIVKGTGLKHSHIPDVLVEIKRDLLKLKREIKNVKGKDRRKELLDRIIQNNKHNPS